MNLSSIRRKAAVAAVAAILAGIHFSDVPVLMSTGMILLVGVAVLNPEIRNTAYAFARDPVSIVISSYFLLHALSGFFSENTEYFLEKLRIKMPFLLLPFAFHAIQPVTKREFNFLLYFFLAVTTLISLGVTAYYLSDFEDINKSYAIAKVMPTPTSHPRFSLIIGFAIVCGGWLFMERYSLRYAWERKAVLASTVFLFIFIHSLAVRSGLLALYAVMIYLVFRHFVLWRRTWLTAAVFAGMALMPVAAYQLFPTFRNKINYVRYDLQTYFSHKSTGEHSDGGRIISIKAGIKVGNKNPLIGVGAGDVLDEMKEIYRRDYPFIGEEHRHIPHNQFAVTYAAFGLTGLAWFLFAFLFPVFYRQSYRNLLLTSLSLIVLTSFLSESTLESQVGVAFYITFLLLILNRMRSYD